MGDRCYMEIKIGGHIETAAMAEAIVKAVEDDCGASDARGWLLAVAEGGARWMEFSEVNYARLSCAGAIADMGIDVLAHNESGGSYPAGWQTFNGLTGETFEWDAGEDGMVDISKIEEILDLPIIDQSIIDGIRSLIAATRASQWRSIRPLTVSDAVRNYLTNS